MKKLKLLFFVIVALMLVLTGCGKDEVPADKKIESVTREENEDIKTVTDSSDVKEKNEEAIKTEAASKEEEASQKQEEEPSEDAPEEKITEKEPEKEEASKEEEPAKESVSADLAAIKEEIVASIGAEGGLDFNDNSIKALYGIEASDMKQCTGFSVMAGTFPHEVVMIEAANDEAAKRIEAAFSNKIETFTQQSKNYDAENYALAKKCKVQRDGMYFAMFLSPDYDSILTVYRKYIK